MDFTQKLCHDICKVGGNSGPDGFECTRRAGHSGSHMANGGWLLGIWDDDLAIRISDGIWYERREVKTFDWAPA